MKLSIGTSRYSKKWKNVELSWADLVHRLQKTVYTEETVKEYRALTKDKQDKIKDIGGFVGGWLKGGLRRSENVLSRSLVTLDADSAAPDFWDTLTLLENYRCCLYSTHKHTPESPRLRLLIPLDRDVSPEEYEAIARKLADNLGIDQFDDTTYQPSRLMYWPSTSSDGLYVFESQDGPVVKADAILASYPDWTDICLWPQSSRVSEIHMRSAKKQGDPLVKDNLVGAFCRTYTIQEAIAAFLSDVYEPTNTSNRYTFKGGSTSGGLVIYEDKLAYSNHSTDPTSGLLCNAFDLVRLHIYKDLDLEAKEGTPQGRLPSYLAMLDLAKDDSKVTELLNIEGYQHAVEDFQGLSTEETPGVRNIEKVKLERDRKGLPRPTSENIQCIFENDPRLENLPVLNEFNNRWELNGKVGDWYSENAPRYWTNDDDACLRIYLETAWSFEARPKIADMLIKYSGLRKHHPIQDYLDPLKWDGKPRLDTLLIEYLNASDEAYTRAVTRKSLVAAVARIYERNKGVKFDNVILLVGDQGCGKSTFISKLGGAWYLDGLTNVGSKESVEQLREGWIIEMSEMLATKRTDRETLKQFFSKVSDTYRAPYDKRPETHNRQCVFWGTTNDFQILSDATGNRRYWPIEVSKGGRNSIWDDLPKERDQIWAEAKHYYKQGETLYLDKVLTERAAVVQDEFSVEDDWFSMIREYLQKNDDLLEITSKNLWLCAINDFLAAKNAYNAYTDGKRIGELMRKMPGWEGPVSIGKERVKGWRRRPEYIVE